jgi:nitrate reductase NapE
MSHETEATAAPAHKKRYETLAFLFLAFVLFPVLAIGIVGGFGFVVWMQHLLFGPPGT